MAQDGRPVPMAWSSFVVPGQGVTMIHPLTRSECNEQLTLTREKYLLAERRLDLFEAGRYHAELQRAAGHLHAHAAAEGQPGRWGRTVRRRLDRLTFDQLCRLTVGALVLVAGIVGGTVRYWTYDQAGDR